MPAFVKEIIKKCKQNLSATGIRAMLPFCFGNYFDGNTY
jgi:hypothetical protein